MGQHRGSVADLILESDLRAVACRFYKRHGMKVVGTVAWKNRTIPGLVYRLSPQMRERCTVPQCCRENDSLFTANALNIAAEHGWFLLRHKIELAAEVGESNLY